jgi:hypothetical protein
VPLSGDNVRQSAFGVADSATSISAGFPEACAAGNTVVLLVVCGRDPSTPSGLTKDKEFANLDVTNTGWMRWFRLPVTSGGETSWTVSEATTTATGWSWWALEIIGLAQAISPVAAWGTDVYEGTSAIPLNAPRTGGELGSAQRLDVVELGASAFWGPRTAAQVAASSWSKLVGASAEPYKTGDFYTQNAGTSNQLNVGFWQQFSNAVGVNSLQVQPDFFDGQTAGDEFWAGWVTYASADSPVLDPIVMGTGFEFGTHHGITGGPTAAPGPAQIADAVSGTHGTAYQVISTAPKNGTYHLRVTAAATVAFVRWTTNTLGAGVGQAVFGGYVKCVSATTNPCVLAEFAPAAGTIVQLVYNTTTTKIGVRWGSGGTVAYQSDTTATGSYAWVDLRAIFNATTWHIDWQCEQSGVLVAQTAPADLTSQTASTWSLATLGSATSQTMTADYDDVCLSNAAIDYPLKRHKVVLLIPDTAVSAGLNGSAGANMSAITNNATGSTLTTTGAANVPALLDEVPPNFSATADGVAAVTAGTTDNVSIDMTTYTASGTERIDAVRLYMAGWAVSATAASFGLRGAASGVETTFVSGSTTHAAFSSTTTGSATVPGWYCKNYPQTAGWTQTKLDSLQIRVGYSSDATPDIGTLAVYAEVAVNVDYVVGAPAPPVIPLQAGSQTTTERSEPGLF